MTKQTDMPDTIWIQNTISAQLDGHEILRGRKSRIDNGIQYTRTDTIAEKDRVMQVMAEALAVGANYSGPQTKDIMGQALAEYAKIKESE
jgi:hypothetical protein